MPIKKFVTDTRIPIKIWTNDIEPEAEAQLRLVAQMPFVAKWVAVMADVHLGKGSTVGSVIASETAIMPSAVGVDIGCGMMAVKTNLKYEELGKSARSIRMAIETSVPVGFGRRTTVSSKFHHFAVLKESWEKVKPFVTKDYDEVLLQLGTLGGGNHFIEVCLDEENCVWVTLHSGSRNVGKQIGEFFTKKAKELNETYHIALPHPDLAYLPKGTKEFLEYFDAMSWCQEYARINRELMMAHAIEAMELVLDTPIERQISINCHHNYATIENHFKQNLIVTRKGAIRARLGDLGIIPGSMGQKSYIVSGLGNPESFFSASHGAGRKMSRTEARKTFTTDDLEKQTIGVDCRKDSDIVDEIPGAYKSIDDVMDNQSDLVSVEHTLKQILCIKG